MADGRRSDCKVCVAAKAAAYRAANPERTKEIGRRFYANHRESRLEYTRQYRADGLATIATVKTRRLTRWWVALAGDCGRSAKRRGLEYDIDADFVLALFERQRGRCHWLGIEMVPSITARDPQRPSVDRIDCSKGYTRDNVVLACQFANMGRSNTKESRFREFLDMLLSKSDRLGDTG